MDLFEKAAELGIQAEFVDGQGQRHRTDPAALKIILDAMPIRAPNRFGSEVVVLRAGEAQALHIADVAALPLSWKIARGKKEIAAGESAGSTIEWPDGLAAGSYRVSLTDTSGFSEQVPLLVAPRSAYAGEVDRSWILAVQLYGVRSARNWGIGDFADLGQLIDLAVTVGADGVGLNPLHALFDDRPGDCSPYAPNSRLFLNPLYIDLEGIAEFPPEFLADNAGELRRVREAEFVDYAGVAALKWRALRATFDRFRAIKGKRRTAFSQFRAERGALLIRFSCFETKRHGFGRPWWEWPEPWLLPDDAACAAFRAGPDALEIEFIEFVQWIADQQLEACSRRAADLGMKVGLYLDVAVGVQSDGFDAWNEQVAISRHLSVGAPPDPLNSAGQNWGLAGFNAAGLEVQSFAPFREMLRVSMRHAGAIRLDHVLGLNRLYLVPHGFAPNHGVYVQMPFEALLAVTAQESVAHRCIVIGEDLGTVPDGFRDKMMDWGIWSYRVMMFERDYHAGFFHGVDHYPADALVTFNTHDLPTFAGWRTGHDLSLKRALGIDPGESDDARHHAIRMLGDVLRHHGIDSAEFIAAIKFLSRTRARLLAVSLEDMLGVTEQPNVPGTVNEHPNWRRRLPVGIEAFADHIDGQALRDATAERSPHR